MTGCCLPSLEAIRTNSYSARSECSSLMFHSAWTLHILSTPVSALVPTHVLCQRTDIKGKRREKDNMEGGRSDELKGNQVSSALQITGAHHWHSSHLCCRPRYLTWQRWRQLVDSLKSSQAPCWSWLMSEQKFGPTDALKCLRSVTHKSQNPLFSGES